MALALLIGLVFSGLLFVLWPTWGGDRQLQLNPEMIAQLASLKAEKKFVEKSGTPLYNKDGTLVFGPPPGWYPGAPNEPIRKAAQVGVDRVIDQLLVDLPNRPWRSTVLASFKRALPAYEAFDSEEKRSAARLFRAHPHHHGCAKFWRAAQCLALRPALWLGDVMEQKRGPRGRMAQFGLLMKVMVPLIALAIPVAGWVLYEISVLFELPQPAIIQNFFWRHSMPPLTLILFLLFGLLMALPVSIGAIALDYYRESCHSSPLISRYCL